jgi:hypothetical protein
LVHFGFAVPVDDDADLLQSDESFINELIEFGVERGDEVAVPFQPANGGAHPTAVALLALGECGWPG